MTRLKEINYFLSIICCLIFKIDHINGKSFTINNMGGNVIKPGYAKIAQNMGMKRKDKIGNLVIKFNIVFPDTLTEEQKKELDKIL